MFFSCSNFTQTKYRAKAILLKFNSFPNVNPTVGIISTKIYLVLLVLLVSILIAYTLITGQSQTIPLENPTETIYRHLSSKYPTTFQCQCNRMAINYESFLSISMTYHPICSSLYVRSEWIRQLFNSNTPRFLPIDFHSLAHSYFLLVATLCSFAQQSLQNTIDDFLLNTIITAEIVSPSSLQQRSEVETSFLRILDQDNEDSLTVASNIISTRLYLLFFCVLTTILIGYTALNTHRSTMTTVNPSEMLYETLL